MGDLDTETLKTLVEIAQIGFNDDNETVSLTVIWNIVVNVYYFAQ